MAKFPTECSQTLNDETVRWSTEGRPGAASWKGVGDEVREHRAGARNRIYCVRLT
jgi:hypothetical protein